MDGGLCAELPTMSRAPAQEALQVALGLVEAARRALRRVPAAVPVEGALARAVGILRELHQAPGLLFDEREDELPPAELAEILERWLAYKAEQHRQRLKPMALQALYRRLREMGPERAREAIKYSIGQGYKGLVEPHRGKVGGWRDQPPPDWYSPAAKRAWWYAESPAERKAIDDEERRTR